MLLRGRGWTELAKEAPGVHLYLVPTPATLPGLTIICERTAALDRPQPTIEATGLPESERRL